mgnify:CR=1 FL=1
MKTYLDGKIQIIPYEDISIIYKENNKNLKPNIYVNTKFLSIGETIRGNIVITCKENEKFKSLNKKQVIHYVEFLKNVSFNYNSTFNPKRTINQIAYMKRNGNYDNIDINVNDDVLKMILSIQTIILKFIQNNSKK